MYLLSQNSGRCGTAPISVWGSITLLWCADGPSLLTVMTLFAASCITPPTHYPVLQHALSLS